MDQPALLTTKPVFETPWFKLLAKHIADFDAPHYSISTWDYVSVLAVTADSEFPLVRQFRPAVEQVTLELPSGHVGDGETPEQSARKELREETGFVAGELILLGSLSPDTGRLGNRMWCFFAPQAVRDEASFFQPEPGIHPVVYRKSLRELVLQEPAFSSALNRATILMAIAAGYIDF